MRTWLTLALIGGLAAAGRAEAPRYAPERPGGSWDDPIERPRDLSGRSIKCPRVRAVHSRDDSLEGTTGHLFARDPWLAYQRGRELFLREFAAADGAFGESGRPAGPVLEDQATKMLTRDHVASCALCHNVPFRDAGAGATIFKNGGTGRNTPHLFGAGLVEMLGWQLRVQLLSRGDANGDGWIAKGESDHVRAIVDNLPASSPGERVSVDFGRFGDLDGDGEPDLNSVCRIIFVDADGKRIPWARTLADPGVAGYSFEVQVFGWGHREGAISSTLRAFSASAFDLHTGLQARDPTLDAEPAGDGLARVSLAGAPQFAIGRPRDRGHALDERGVSLDDPDRDGVLEEITEGDLDLVELYQLNHPAPAEKLRTPLRERGRELLTTLACTRCHVPDWQLLAGDPASPDPARRSLGDRRFFDLQVEASEEGELRGRLVRLDPEERAGLVIRGVYSDFAHHDLGEAFHQMQFDGSMLTEFRTAPLWGVGSTAPYGHDGASLDLDAVIRRHGGEAAREAAAYAATSDLDRLALLEFLRGLVLYSVDDLPTDIDGDGKIADHFVVAGQDTGRERLNPEWLFRIPGRIEGFVTNPDGVKVFSLALTNADEAYGLALRFLADRDRDGFPDARFAEPGDDD